MSVRSLGRLTLDLVVKLGGFTAGMSQAERETERRTKAMRNHLRGLQSAFGWLTAGAGAAALTATIGRVISLGDQLDKVATKAGVSGEAISELAHAAKMVDVDIAGLSNALRVMQTNLSEAATGAKGPLQALKALGLQLNELRGLSADRQFERIADQISKLADPADRARAATELFGRAGSDLLPLFEEGAEGIRKAREEAERLGVSFSGQQLQSLAEADDAIKRLRASFDGLATSLAVRVAPSLSYFIDEITGLVSSSDIPRLRVLQEEIRVLEESIARGGGTFLTPFISFGAYGGAPDVKAGILSLEEQIEALAKLRKTMRALTAPGRGGTGATPPGFAPEGTSEEFDKVEASLRQQIALYGSVGEAAKLSYQLQFGALKELDDVQKQRLISLAEQYDAMVTAADAAEKAERDRLQAMYLYADAQQAIQDDVAESLEAGAEQIRNSGEMALDYIQSIHDEWAEQSQRMRDEEELRTAEIKGIWDEGLFSAWRDGLDGMLEYWIKTLQQMAIQAASTSLFNTGGIGNFFSGLFGGFMADGGPLEQGKWYIAGEHGPEPIWGGGAGAYAMGYGQPSRVAAGSAHATKVEINQHNDFRGASMDVMRAMPSLLEASNRKVKQELIEFFDRRGMQFT